MNLGSASSFNHLYKIISNKERQKEQENEKVESNKVEKPKMNYFSAKLIKYLLNFCNILKTCDGRDKLCSFIQYSSKFYATILYHSIDVETLNSTEDPFIKHDAFKNVEKSMSSGRKIFRFLKWIENLKGIYYYIIYKQPSLRNMFKALMAISSFFYHLFDNLLWASNLGLLSEYLVGEIKIKNTKNVFSLLRNIIKIFMDINKFKDLYYINKNNEEEVYEVFEKRVENFESNVYDKVLVYTLEIRKKLRIKLFDIVHSFLRICMLLFSLKLEPFYSNLHPIFIGFCGSLHSIIALYKTLQDPDLNAEEKLKNKKKLEKQKSATPDDLKGNKIPKRKSLLLMLDENEESQGLFKNNIFSDGYFKNYYIDFNKDFPMDPVQVFKIA